MQDLLKSRSSRREDAQLILGKSKKNKELNFVVFEGDLLDGSIFPLKKTTEIIAPNWIFCPEPVTLASNCAEIAGISVRLRLHRVGERGFHLNLSAAEAGGFLVNHR